MGNQKATYLQMIQNIISRMAENSFKIKGWGIGVIISIVRRGVLYMKENAKILKGFPYHPYPHETTDPIKIIKFPDNYEFTSDELRILEARLKKKKR